MHARVGGREELPRKVAVVGAGYIAVELAGVLNTLGSEVDLFVRGEGALRSFDHDIARFLNGCLTHDGIDLVTHANVQGAERAEDGTISLDFAPADGVTSRREGYDTLIYAVGRWVNRATCTVAAQCPQSSITRMHVT
eukprot:COSAG01_NODE_13012_length_1649_cov_1.708387_2_plen_138_part_00